MPSPASLPPRPAAIPPGQPLAPTLRARLERQMGADLGAVRLHTDGSANRVAGAHRANAVTLGRDVFFAAGRFQPETPVGFGLLVHELTHVRQLAAGAVPGGPLGHLAPMQRHALEAEAHTHERAAMLGLPLPALRTSFATISSGHASPATSMPLLPPLRAGEGGWEGEVSRPSSGGEVSPFRPLQMPLSAPHVSHPPALRQEVGTAVAPPSSDAAADDSANDTAAPAAADPDALAEQVYTRIERRLRLERERGGTRRWR